jgi:aminoglycoside phosphotransferase (APT) family kinase protein
MTRKMHANEVMTDAALVRRLLAAQFPQWAELPIAPVPSAGTDNALYRLGDALAVRLPRIEWATGQVGLEQRWLPMLAPHVPLTIPAPLAVGQPGAGYPWQWSVCPWLAGEIATLDRLADPRQVATDLAHFILALQQVDVTSAPTSVRGVPLITRDARMRECIAAMDGLLDVAAVTAEWEAALAAPEWAGAPVWIHGDLQPGNLLAQAGRLSAVIDWGCMGLGDPAVELLVAWNLFDAESRTVLREALGVDDATWARGRGWALSMALIALPYYLHTNPGIVAMAWRILDELLADPGA